MSCKLVTFAVLCVLSIVVAACARHDRACAVEVAGIIAVNWLACSMPWIDVNLSYSAVVKALGGTGKQTDGMALFDLIAMVMVVLVGCRVWWSAIIWSVFFVQLTMHAVAWANDLQYADYAPVLDAALVVQLAAIFMVGGPGCADRVLRCWRFCRMVCASAHQMVVNKVASS